MSPRNTAYRLPEEGSYYKFARPDLGRVTEVGALSVGANKSSFSWTTKIIPSRIFFSGMGRRKGERRHRRLG